MCKYVQGCVMMRFEWWVCMRGCGGVGLWLGEFWTSGIVFMLTLKCRARENMQFKKVKKEIINCKKRDFA